MIRFHALGGVTITENGDELAVGGPRQRRLLAMLLIHRDTVVSVDRLADAVFAGEPTPAAGTTMRSYVTRIRKVVEHDGSSSSIVTQAPGYMLRVAPGNFDVGRFEALVAEGRAHLTRDDAPTASAELREALSLWRGDAYAEFADEDWARPEAQRLGELRLVASESLADADLACGRAAEIIPQLESLAAEHPMRESFRAQLMTALYRSGRQADALRVFRDYRDTLIEELGLDPTPALQDLERRILAQDPSLALGETAGLPLRGYRLGERLGTGRDGTVYAARLPGVERDYVIRVYREDVADDPHFVRAFEADAHRVAALRHPAIVAIQDYWREPGAAYVVMRRMHGGSLDDRLERGPLSRAELVALIVRIGGALTAAAEAEIVHGRISASSVLLDDAGQACLADFGLGCSSAAAATQDVHDFAQLVERCVGSTDVTFGEVLTRGLATVDRPSIDDFVMMLQRALADEPVTNGAPLPNPYKGLRAFDETDAVDFFGRGDLVDEMLCRLRDDGLRGRLILLVAGSGTGKSSVVRAGLLPRIRGGDVPGSDHWYVTTMLPGGTPFKELAESLRRVAVVDPTQLADRLADEGGIDREIRRIVPGDAQVLLVIDQFEELFTMATEAEQHAFLDGLMHAVTVPYSRLRVVATLRADFFDRPLGFQWFGAAVNDATVTISAMAPADLEAAIMGPATRVGRDVELPLVAELVSAVSDEPAALPSLQFTLYELAEDCERMLTLSAYRAMGGIRGAIASRAEMLYRSLEDDERTSVRRVFEQLVVVPSEGEATRRPAERTELTGVPADPVVDTMIDRWIEARLLSADRHPQTRVPTVEVAHEALLREWPRLRRWIEEDRERLIVLGHLREAARSWLELGRDPGALYRGARLEVALDLASARADSLPASQREFIDASRDERDREAKQEAERVARQARANRRLRIQLFAIAAALVVAIIVGFIALDQRGKAERERRVATARELAAAANNQLADDPQRSMLLALAAIDETRGPDGAAEPEAIDALHTALTADRLVHSYVGLGGALEWSSDGSVFVTEGPEDTGLIDIRGAATGESVLAFHGHDIDVNDVAFSDDGSMLATVGDDGDLRVWATKTGTQLASFETEGTGYGLYAPSFSPDGSLVAASWLEAGLTRVFDIATQAMVTEIDSGWTLGTDFSPDGRFIAYASSDALSQISVADVGTGDVRFSVDTNGDWERDIAYSPDGRWIATSGEIAEIWDASDGSRVFSLPPYGHVNDVAWSPDGSRFATVADDGTARVFDLDAAGPREIVSLSDGETQAGLQSLAFSPDGTQIMTSDWVMTAVKIWDVSPTGGAEWTNLAGAPVIGAATFDSGGRTIIASTGGDQAAIWDAVTGRQLDRVGAPQPLISDSSRIEVSSDGRSVAMVTGDAQPVDVWDTATGSRLFTVSEPDNPNVWGLAWSQDGERLAVGGADPSGGYVIVVNRSGALIARVPEESDVIVGSVAFSPDGRHVAWVRKPARDDPARKWATILEVEREEVVGKIPADGAIFFDPTGRWIATTRMNEGGVDIWDATTLDPVATLTGTAPFISVAFSDDGARLAAGGADGVVRLWNTETWRPERALSGHATAVSGLDFSPDGKRLVTTGGDGIVRVWALDLDDLISIARSKLTRGLTDEECRQYLHLDRCPGSSESSSSSA